MQRTTDKVSLNDLYMAYCNYCDEQNYNRVIAKNSFKESCMELGLKLKSSAASARRNNFIGIKLKAVSSDFDFDNTDNSDDLAEVNDEI